MMLVASALSLSTGLAMLCLAMDRHHRDLFGRVPGAARRRLLRAGGWAALALSLAGCVAGWGWARGVVYWCLAATPIGLAIVFALPLVAPATSRRAAGSGRCSSAAGASRDRSAGGG